MPVSLSRLFVCFALPAFSLLQAAEPAANADLTAEEEAQLAALLSPQPTWQRELTLRASIGWKDNVLLSPAAEIERGLGRAELEAFLWRPMQGGWEAVSYLNGDLLRYLDPPAGISGEQQWFGHGELRLQPRAWARLAVKADAFLQDAVIDLSETQGVPIAAQTRMHGTFATAATRFALPRGLTFEPSFQYKRTGFREFPGDYDETVAGGRLEWKGDRLRFSAGWFERARRYDERPQFTAGGRELPDTRLRFRQREADAKAGFTWRRGGEWTLTASAGWLENRDEVSGYFDYDQRRAGLVAEWETQRWRVSLDGDARRLEYRVQTVGTGIAPPPRIADLFDTRLRVERTLGETWRLFAEHGWERHRSNEPDFNYRGNTTLAGVERTF